MRLMTIFVLGMCIMAVSDLSALETGKHAPPLATVNWVKGSAIEPADRITVVEFWATWCGPCRESIPHLTALQKRHGAKIQIAGLSNEDAPTVEPFVEMMGTKMDYHIGIADEATYSSYMEGVDEIPRAFLIDAKGIVVWQGHPGGLDTPLSQLVAGTFDVDWNLRVGKLHQELEEILSVRNPDIEKTTAKVDELLALDPVNDYAIDVRLAIGAFTKDPKMVRDTLAGLPLDKLSAEQANALAWARVTDESLVNRNLDLALRFAHRALTLEPDNATFLDTQARLLYAIGRLDEAIEVSERAAKLRPDGDAADASSTYYRQARELGRAHAAGATPAQSSSPTAVPVP